MYVVIHNEKETSTFVTKKYIIHFYFQKCIDYIDTNYVKKIYCQKCKYFSM